MKTIRIIISNPLDFRAQPRYKASAGETLSHIRKVLSADKKMNKAALSLFTGTEAGFAAVQQPGSAGASRWLIFRQPVETLTGFRPEDVLPCLRRIEEAAVRGLHSAGFLCYEAAPAFDQAFASAPPDGMPLFWFGLYHAPAVYEFQPPSIADIHTKPVFSGTPEVGLADYHRQIGKIKEYIGAGDCYQVNCTCRFRGGASAIH